MTPAEAGALARDAGAGVLVLSHLWVEDDPFRAVREASQVFGGPVRARHTRAAIELGSKLRFEPRHMQC